MRTQDGWAFRAASMYAAGWPRTRPRPDSAVSVQDLTRFAETFADLADPDVMSQAWR